MMYDPASSGARALNLAGVPRTCRTGTHVGINNARGAIVSEKRRGLGRGWAHSSPVVPWPRPSGDRPVDDVFFRDKSESGQQPASRLGQRRDGDPGAAVGDLPSLVMVDLFQPVVPAGDGETEPDSTPDPGPGARRDVRRDPGDVDPSEPATAATGVRRGGAGRARPLDQGDRRSAADRRPPSR